MTEEKWTKGRIRYELDRLGWTTFRDIDAAHKLPAGTITNTIHRGDWRGEEILSKILGVPAHRIWPDRYDSSGQRIQLRARRNRTPEPDNRHRQKRCAA